MSILIFIIILAVLIVVHEFGHFIVAKKGGIRVDEFGLGYPPRAKKLFRRNGTDFTLNWLPFGGFVKIYGESNDGTLGEEDKDKAFISKPRWIQALVLFAGPAFNFIFAWLLILITLFVGLPTTISPSMQEQFIHNEKTIITDVVKGSPAEMSGLLPGDIVNSVSVGGKDYPRIDVADLHNLVIANPDQTFTVDFERLKENQVVTVKPALSEESNEILLGIGIDNFGVYKPNFANAFIDSFKFTWAMIAGIAGALWGLVKGIFVGGSNIQNLTGPVGIIGLVGDASKLGIVYLLSFTALISVNLGIINLIPFPALDGGRLLFLLIEKVKGGRVNHKIMNFLNFAGFSILILLMLFITYKDILRLFQH